MIRPITIFIFDITCFILRIGIRLQSDQKMFTISVFYRNRKQMKCARYLHVPLTDHHNVPIRRALYRHLISYLKACRFSSYVP